MDPVVSIIDDDHAVLDAVGMLLSSRGHTVARFSDARSFLAASPTGPGCIVSDVRMPGMNGIELLRALKAAGDRRPVLLLTAHGDIEMAMQAIRLGAADFIEKPFKDERLLTAVAEALAAGAKLSAAHDELVAWRERFEMLTERQRQTMRLMLEGHATKEIAVRLGISARTVEIHRSWVMSKMGARSLAHLVRIGMRLGVDDTAAGGQP